MFFLAMFSAKQDSDAETDTDTWGKVQSIFWEARQAYTGGQSKHCKIIQNPKTREDDWVKKPSKNKDNFTEEQGKQGSIEKRLADYSNEGRCG